jgi:small-conductance mechanosensitive channel
MSEKENKIVSFFTVYGWATNIDWLSHNFKNYEVKSGNSSLQQDCKSVARRHINIYINIKTQTDQEKAEEMSRYALRIMRRRLFG